MKTSELKSKLNQIKDCLANEGSIIPILSHFCFKKGQIVAFNGVQAAIVKHDSDLELAVPGSSFLKVINSFSTELEIKQKENKLFIKSGKSKSNLNGLSKDDFIFNLLKSHKKFINITNDFIEGISKTLLSISQDVFMASMSGVTLEVEAGIGTLYSTDTSTVSRYQLLDKIDFEDTKILLPELFCKQLVNFSKKDKNGVMYLSIEDEYIYVEFEESSLYSKIQKEIDFIDFSGVFEDIEIDNNLFMKPEKELVEKIDRSILFSERGIEEPFVNISIEDKSIELSSSNTIGNYEDTFEIDKDIENCEFKINPILISRGLNNVEKFSFMKRKKTGRMIFVGKFGNYLYLVDSFEE